MKREVGKGKQAKTSSVRGGGGDLYKNQRLPSPLQGGESGSRNKKEKQLTYRYRKFEGGRKGGFLVPKYTYRWWRVPCPDPSNSSRGKG